MNCTGSGAKNGMGIMNFLAKRPLTVARLCCAFLAPVGVAGVLAPDAAYAQSASESRAAARAAAESGIKEYKQGNYEKAEDLMERAETLYHAPVHLLYLARARVKLGKLVLARETYISLTREELTSSSPTVSRDAVEAAHQELEELSPRIGRLTIKVTPTKVDREVRVGEVVIPSAMVGLERPVDPGSYTVTVNADGYASRQVQVNIKEGASETVEVSLVALPPSARAAQAKDKQGQPTDVEDSGPSAGKITGYALLGVAAVGVGVGGYFTARAITKSNQANDEYECYPNCTYSEKERVDELDQQSKTAKIVAFASFGVGAAALVSSVTLLVLNRTPSEKTARAHIDPWIGFQTVGVRGTF